jgi:bacillithiol biosynthesis cysteine-adding enzyme BshC
VTSGDVNAESLYPRKPASFETCAKAAQEILQRPRDWKSLANILREAGKHYGVPDSTLERLDLLKEGKAVAVVTGQQVGYLGGPFYTFLKAYHATRLAKELERKLSLPVLPIFWLEGEDHDLEEVREANILNAAGELVTSRFEPKQVIPNCEVGLYEVDARTQLDELAQHIGQFSEDGMAVLKETYSSTTLSDAMGRLLAELLGLRGLFVVEGMDARLKRTALPLWSNVLKLGPELGNLLQSRTEELYEQVWPAPLKPTSDSYLFYLTDKNHCRCPVSYSGLVQYPDGAKDKLKGRTLENWIEKAPEIVSPKAALRPLYQDFVLPTIAYIGGPGELEYHAQLCYFYEVFQMSAPVLFPRLSVSIMDAKSARNLEKLGLTAEQVLCDSSNQLAKTLLHDSDEHHTSELFAKSRHAIESSYQNLKSALEQIDPTLAGAVESSIGKSLHPLEQLQQKTDKALKQKHAITLARLTQIQTALKPHNKFPERVLSTAHYLLKYGPEELLDILDKLPIDGKSHSIIVANDRERV